MIEVDLKREEDEKNGRRASQKNVSIEKILEHSFYEEFF
jgi:hypothetical protein